MHQADVPSLQHHCQSTVFDFGGSCDITCASCGAPLRHACSKLHLNVIGKSAEGAPRFYLVISKSEP